MAASRELLLQWQLQTTELRLGYVRADKLPSSYHPRYLDQSAWSNPLLHYEGCGGVRGDHRAGGQEGDCPLPEEAPLWRRSEGRGKDQTSEGVLLLRCQQVSCWVVTLHDEWCPGRVISTRGS